PTIRSSAADVDLPAPGSCLPPLDPSTAARANSPCIDNPAYTAQLATIQTGNSSNPDPVFSVPAWTKANAIHLGPGLKIQANPHFSLSGHTALVNLTHYLGSGDYDHASHSRTVIVDWL